MFLNYLFHFSKEYVILLIKGENAERFFNICTRRGISLKNIRCLSSDTFEAEISAADFKYLRPIAHKTRTRVHIKKKQGVKSTLRRYRKRVFFAAGFLICAAFFAVTSQFVWSIEVTGTKRVGDIKAAALLAGVDIGAYKPFLPDGNEMKNVILSNTDNITWAWVYLKGTKAVIDVREAILPPKMTDLTKPCDIAAAHDGIITDITVKEGVTLCKKNDVVAAGDILIGGTYENEDGTYRLEHALGDVSAITYHSAKREVKLYKELRKETGKKKKFVLLKVFSKNIPLYFNTDINFEDYKIKHECRELKWGKEHYLGIELVSDTYLEEEVRKIPITPEEAAEGVRDELEKQIAKELLPGAVKKGSETSYTMSGDDCCEVSLTMQFIEKIGMEVPIDVQNTKDNEE